MEHGNRRTARLEPLARWLIVFKDCHQCTAHFSSLGLSIDFSLLANMSTITAELLSQWHQDISHAEDDFITGIPKIELHIHLEGTLTPSWRWELAQKRRLTIRNNKTNLGYDSLEEMEASYYPILAQGYKHGGPTTFFEDYMDGFRVLRDEEDFSS